MSTDTFTADRQLTINATNIKGISFALLMNYPQNFFGKVQYLASNVAGDVCE